MIKLSNAATSNLNNDQFFLNLETNYKEKSAPDINIYINPASLNKIMQNIENFCNIYIKI